MIIGKLHILEKDFMNNQGADYILTEADVCDIKEFMKLTMDNFVTAQWQIGELQKEINELKTLAGLKVVEEE